MGTKVVCFFGGTGTLGGPLGGPFGGPLGFSTGSSVVWGWRDHWGPQRVLLWWEMVQGKGDGGKGWLLGVRARGCRGRGHHPRAGDGHWDGARTHLGWVLGDTERKTQLWVGTAPTGCTLQPWWKGNRPAAPSLGQPNGAENREKRGSEGVRTRRGGQAGRSKARANGK